MKKLILPFLVMASALTTAAQDTEFTIHDNGLIYDEQTMARLGSIVDSLNLRFKTCEPKNYHSLGQGLATVVTIKKNTPGARHAMENEITLEDFLQHFPGAKHREEWIVKFRYKDYRDKKILEYSSLPLRNENRFSLELTDRRVNDKSLGWVFRENDKNLIGVYLHSVQRLPIPRRYSELIQYVDCMIDTTAQIYRSGSQLPYSGRPGSREGRLVRPSRIPRGECASRRVGDIGTEHEVSCIPLYNSKFIFGYVTGKAEVTRQVLKKVTSTVMNTNAGRNISLQLNTWHVLMHLPLRVSRLIKIRSRFLSGLDLDFVIGLRFGQIRY